MNPSTEYLSIVIRAEGAGITSELRRSIVVRNPAAIGDLDPLCGLHAQLITALRAAIGAFEKDREP